jgi:hypothetical protein
MEEKSVPLLRRCSYSFCVVCTKFYKLLPVTEIMNERKRLRWCTAAHSKSNAALMSTE